MPFLILCCCFEVFVQLLDFKATQGKEKRDGDWRREYNRSWRADDTELDEKIKSAEDFIIITL